MDDGIYGGSFWLDALARCLAGVVKIHADECHKCKYWIEEYADNILHKTQRLIYKDNTFDFVYCAQILHWTNPKKGITEMLRVTKPGGFVFGTQGVSPRVPINTHAHIIAVKGAQGFFTKDDLIKWAKEAGAKKVKTAYPLITVCFKFIK